MSKIQNGNLIQVIFFALFMGFCVQANAAGKIETVEATGMGATQEKAIKNATKEAVRQVVGMYVVSEAVTKNRKLIKDEVLSASNGFVRKFTTLEKEVDEDGIHTVTAKVEVEVGKLTEALTGLNIATKTVDSDNLTAQIVGKAETAQDFTALAHKVIFEPLEKNKGIYKIDLNFFTGLVSDDTFDEEKWMSWAKFDSYGIVKRPSNPRGLTVSDDWVPIQMTMKVGLKDAYLDGIEQFLEKNSKSKTEGASLKLGGKRFNTVLIRDLLMNNMVAWKLGKQNAKTLLKLNNRFGANFETYLKLTLLGEGGRNLGQGTYVKGKCPNPMLTDPKYPTGSDMDLSWQRSFHLVPTAPATYHDINLKPSFLSGRNHFQVISDYIPKPNIVSSGFFLIPAGAKYDFKKGGRLRKMVNCGGGLNYAEILLGRRFVYAEKTSAVAKGSAVAMTVFEKGTYHFTWFNIFFLPPETAKQLKSGKAEIITVQTLEDE